MQNPAWRAAVLVAWIAAVAPGASLADQAQVDSACADPSSHRGVREMDPNDQVDAAVMAKVGKACGRSLRQLTDLSFGDELRTYSCGIWFWRHPTPQGQEQLQIVREALAGIVSNNLPGPGLNESDSFEGYGRGYLFLTRDGIAIESIVTETTLERRTRAVHSVWGAADLIQLTAGRSVGRPNLCQAKIETTPDGWSIRDVRMHRNCNTTLVRDYFVSRAGHIAIRSEKPGRVIACAD